MAFKLESVVPWGRNMQEYRAGGVTLRYYIQKVVTICYSL